MCTDNLQLKSVTCVNGARLILSKQKIMEILSFGDFELIMKMMSVSEIDEKLILQTP